MSGTWVWIVGLGLLLLIQNASGTCDVKFADGLGKNDKRIFVLGERAELKCDVTAMDPTQDVLYWKYDEKVFSENNLVMKLYKDKYNVSLGPVGGKKIYTLSFIVEADDVGKYNCTCGSGGIQYPVWVKVPCDKEEHVTKDEKVTSKEIIDYLNMPKPREPLDVPCGTVTYKLGSDCKCTWPEVNRKLEVEWNPPLPNSDFKPVGNQDPNVKPLSCYTGVGSVTFRYKDVIVLFKLKNKIPFTCDYQTNDKVYGFYIDEGRKTTTPDILLKVRCTCTVTPRPTPTPPPECPECPTIGILEIILIVTGVITLICTVLVIKITCTYKYWKKINTKKSRCLAGLIIAVLAAVVFCVIVVFILRIANKLPDLEGNPIDPCCEIGGGSIAGFVIILLVALIAIFVYGVFLWKQRVPICKTHNCGNPVHGYFSPCRHSKICLSCAKKILKDPPGVCPTCGKIVDDYYINTNCKTQNCGNPVHGYFTPCHHSKSCVSCAKEILKDPRAVCPTCRKIVDDYYYPDPKADNNTVTHVSVSSTLPQRDQQPVDARTSDFSNIQTENGGLTNQNPKTPSAPVAQPQNRNTKYMDKELKNDYEDVPPPLTKPTEKKTDQDAKLCNQTCKNPPNAKICEEPCKNPVDGYFPLCGHSDICSSCATEILEDPHGVCPTPNCGMLVNEYMKNSDANARGLWNQRV